MQNRFSYKLLTQAFHPLNNLVYNSLLVVPQTNRVIISVERIKANIHILVISKIWGRCIVTGTGTEVNPESWTQLKGSNETYI